MVRAEKRGRILNRCALLQVELEKRRVQTLRRGYESTHAHHWERPMHPPGGTGRKIPKYIQKGYRDGPVAMHYAKWAAEPASQQPYMNQMAQMQQIQLPMSQQVQNSMSYDSSAGAVANGQPPMTMFAMPMNIPRMPQMVQPKVVVLESKPELKAEPSLDRATAQGPAQRRSLTPTFERREEELDNRQHGQSPYAPQSQTTLRETVAHA
eukprot:FR735520.1.p1 GENE.FR735520.1~~FR735520.1.p1  ORF type:complete len:225 (+),score=4.51 FR735520.1:51-677(+)